MAGRDGGIRPLMFSSRLRAGTLSKNLDTLDGRHLQHIVRISTDSSLTEVYEEGGFHEEMRSSFINIAKNYTTLQTACSVSRTTRGCRMGLELAHVLVERVSGTTKAGNQGTPLPLRIIGIRFPFARTRTGRIACKTRFPWVWIVRRR